ncbi:hypothetical protein E3U55_04375 [Filobacillus milosensis]|uniref:YNCE-like beta-propeller domain-containing protein n=1 Tax=Filobacillus milosensis TaxID=94137 RepID=A0A4Y8IQX3_9BACI|nr:cytochrome D1 domain-containing protein [Filobacillus milosensis]TFB24054.1 hypothetical protein E3U55_04375 [Filobacillus milosensis]
MKHNLLIIALIFISCSLAGCAMVTQDEIDEQNKASQLTSVQFYVPSEADNKISIIDIRSSKVVGEIETGEKPANLVFSSTMRRAYVANQNSSTVGIINTQSLKMTKEIEVGPLPHGIAITPNNKTLYVTTVGDQYVYVINTEQEKVVNQIDLGKGAKTNYPYLNGDQLIVSDHENNRVYLVENNKLTKTFETSSTPRVIKTNNNGNQLYVATSEQVEVFDIPNGEKVAQFKVGEGVTDFVITEDGSKLISTNMEGKSITIYDLDNQKIIKKLDNISTPKHISFNRKQTKAYITLNGTNKVAVLNMETNEIVEEITVGDAPHGIQIKALPGIGGSC